MAELSHSCDLLSRLGSGEKGGKDQTSGPTRSQQEMPASLWLCGDPANLLAGEPLPDIWNTHRPQEAPRQRQLEGTLGCVCAQAPQLATWLCDPAPPTAASQLAQMTVTQPSPKPGGGNNASCSHPSRCGQGQACGSSGQRLGQTTLPPPPYMQVKATSTGR